MRYPKTLLARIAETLAELFGNRGDILSVLDEAGMQAHGVNLEQGAGAVWADAVDEADKLGFVAALLTVALRRYPTGDASKVLAALLAGVRAVEDAARSAVPRNSEKNGRGA